MIKFKDYIASMLVGKTLRFHCDCLIPFDITGKVVSYRATPSELVFDVMEKGTQKIITISSNQSIIVEEL